MKKFIWIITFIFLAYQGTISGQAKKWTLEDCINYAVTNNLELRRQKLQTEISQANLLKSKLDILPTLNFGSDAQVGFGRSINPVTNLITFKQNFSNSYSINSNIDLFTGFTNLNTISANKFMLQAGLETEKIVRNNLVGEILMQYYQVIYATGLENASKMQLDLSEKQLQRITVMVETGREAESKKYEIESQASADKLAYTVAKNTSSQAVTTLKQMLQLEPGTEFELLIPDMNSVIIVDSNYQTDSIFKIASEVLPRLKEINFELRASEKQIAAAKGGISPRISGGGSIFTGYYTVLSGDSSLTAPFNDQLKNNNSQAVYLSLRIPLFNNYTTGRNIKLAKIRKNDNELRLELEKNNIYTEVENACLNFNRGKDEFMAAEANFEYNKKSFNAVEKKFESGLIDVTGYSTAKTTLFKAETEALRTKLQLVIRKLFIQFYSTGEYQNLIIN